MAILNNPMGAIAAVNRTSVIVSSTSPTWSSPRTTGSAGSRHSEGMSDDGTGGIGTRQFPDRLADQWCKTRFPAGEEAWQLCRAACQANHPDKPCAVSCFHASDGRGGCVLKYNCSACDEALSGPSGDVVPWQT